MYVCMYVYQETRVYVYAYRRKVFCFSPFLPPLLLVLSFVVVVVGGMGSLPGAVAAGFLLGILESFASMSQVIDILPGINQIIIYLVAIIILLTRPRGLMGRKGVMEE